MVFAHTALRHFGLQEWRRGTPKVTLGAHFGNRGVTRTPSCAHQATPKTHCDDTAVFKPKKWSGTPLKIRSAAGALYGTAWVLSIWTLLGRGFVWELVTFAETVFMWPQQKGDKVTTVTFPCHSH